MGSGEARRIYSHGAELLDGGASFRVWADQASSVAVVLAEGDEWELEAEGHGWFSKHVARLGAGQLYVLRIDGGERLADPASKAQVGGPKGWSALVDPATYRWSDHGWAGVAPRGQVLYEFHVGTFTTEGTLAAAMGRLPFLADLGVTVLEMMPIAEFNGRFGWGYDGALPYAPYSKYGTPDDLRAFVDAAHGHGLGVILDVVYNHFGPGNRFSEFSARWFTDRYENEWGASLNFDGEGTEPVREYIAENAAYWISDFHFDGLRLDATQALLDASEDHIIARIARAARKAAGERRILLIGENEPQDVRLITPDVRGGYGLDALWNDDFHHSVQVALTGRREAYFHDYSGSPQELVSAARFGFLFQGQRYDWQDAPRGTPDLALAPTTLINFLENHDQVANTARGLRSNRLADAARLRAVTTLLLLAPQTPMLFQGEEFWASAPFHYFADQGAELDARIASGRAESLEQFASFRDAAARAALPDPSAPETFAACRLDWSECEANSHIVAFHRDLLRLRREAPAFSGQIANGCRVDGSVVGTSVLLLRFSAGTPLEERLLLVNLGGDFAVNSIADPLFAPPLGLDWAVVLSSEDAVYGGIGRREVNTSRRFVLSANTAIVLGPGERHSRAVTKDLTGWQRLIA